MSQDDRDRGTWPEIIYRFAEHYYWEPQHLGKKKHPLDDWDERARMRDLTGVELFYELVRRQDMRRFIPRFSSRYLDFSSKRSVGWYAHTAKISSSGTMGDPTKGTREKGERMWDVMIRHLVEFVEELKNMSLDEIYQKRY